MSNRPHRYPSFPYTGECRYFLTICANRRAPVFREALVARHISDQFLRCSSETNFEVLAYCAMPDHFHGLVIGLTAGSDLKEFVQRWKQVTGYWWKRAGRPEALWQRGYFDRVLRDDDDSEMVIRYILMNPVRAGLVADARDYPFVGASKYDTAVLLESACLWTPPWKNGRA